MDAPSDSISSCDACNKPQDMLDKPLKNCAKCKSARYCSHDCQKAHWKTHKRVCGMTGPSRQTAEPHPRTARHNPGFESVNRLFGLSNNDHLHGLTEDEATKQLIDCFRMRMEDEYVFGAKNIGIYGGKDPLPVFRKFLDLAETRAGILPAWWDAEKRQKCERIAMGEGGGWSDINCAVEKKDIQDHYNNGTMPMMLRILGEKIYGKGFT